MATNKRHKKGFTLLELLMVVTIIGIIAAIALPLYTGYVKKARIGEIVYSLGAVKDGIIAYREESGSSRDAGDAGTIKSVYGVDVPTQHAAFAYVAAENRITATSSVPGIPGIITLTGSGDYKTWTWGGTVTASLLPRN